MRIFILLHAFINFYPKFAIYIQIPSQIWFPLLHVIFHNHCSTE